MKCCSCLKNDLPNENKISKHMLCDECFERTENSIYSIKFKNKITGEIKTQIPLMEIAEWEKLER